MTYKIVEEPANSRSDMPDVCERNADGTMKFPHGKKIADENGVQYRAVHSWRKVAPAESSEPEPAAPTAPAAPATETPPEPPAEPAPSGRRAKS